MKLYQNILETIGNTPIVKINKLAPSHVNLYVKIEAFNPMGSVKDRLALGVIEHAEKTGAIKPGQTVIEATSGNTGIGLAMVCAHKGYPLIVTMAESFSVERRKMMRFLGAKVVLTPAALKGSGMVKKAVELAEEHNGFLCRQFENEANADMHSRTTAPEILEAFGNEKLDYWVTGYGTGGTLKGVAKVLKEHSPDTKIVVCEPNNANLLGSGIKQKQNADGSPAESHSQFRPHMMQGWTPDFISKLTNDATEGNLVDHVLPIDGQESLTCSRNLARKEGIFVGITAGATFAGALALAETAPKGTNILCMLPDTGERYLSTPLFGEILEEMDDNEWALSKSTPGARFDIPSAAPVKASDEPPVINEAAKQQFETLIADKNEPVVVFALEWCEFCWSVKKLLTKCGISFKTVDLDSAAYQENNLGNDIRNAMNAHTSCITIPQIFINGDFVGGCTEVFDEFKQGKLQERLDTADVNFDRSVKVDPYSMLPKWLQPR